jgi:outer membrane protein assembly factor BamB
MNKRKTALMLILLILAALNIGAARPSAHELLRASGISGGIALHIGCNDGRLSAALHSSDRLLVHGLDTEAQDVKIAQAYIDSLGLYGRVWAEHYDGKNLPHGDNLVNLIVLEDAGELATEEIVRVLAPNGVLLVKADSPLLPLSGLKKSGDLDGWIKYTKPWPEAIDEWTHFLYDASGNAVSKDRQVGHPRHLQWYAGPKHSRHHDALASMSAMTSSGGRVFYIFDEGPISVVHQPSKWKLIARDAFNGKLLWKRAIPTWMTHLYNFRAGPQQLPRRLVSVGDKVYVTLGFAAPVTQLDGATGKTVQTYAGSEKTEELIYHQGMLLTVKGDPNILMDRSDQAHGYWDLAENEQPGVDKQISAYDADTGSPLWTVRSENLKYITPLSLCAQDDRVFYLDNRELHCLDAESGQQRWASPFSTRGLFIRSYAPTVAIHDDVIMCLTWNRLHGFSVKTGALLWENKGSMGFGSPGDLFGINGKVWLTPLTKSIWRESKRNKDGIITTGIAIPRTDFLKQGKTGVGIDVHTGEIVDDLPFAHNQHHHRCYRDKATERYLLIGYSGIQLVDPETKKGAVNQWVRGLCQYGIMPANGYIYVPTHPCRCYGNFLVNGFFALGERNSMDGHRLTPVLEKGPAYAQASTRCDAWSGLGGQGGWPTYRGNIRRSASTKDELPDRLSPKWETRIGPGISAPVITGNSVFVAQKDGYAVHCLDRKTGVRKWKFLANGPIDSPPTIYAGLCLVGCGDGSVYCLNAETGDLAWRFKVSGMERRVGSENRLESPLPVSGSVLVLEDVVYFAAGRSSNLDGGIRIYGLDVWTGKTLHSRVVASGFWSQNAEDGIADSANGRKGKLVTGALADLLISDGNSISMRQIGLTKTLAKGSRGTTILPSIGLLDDSWFDRRGWSYQRMAGQLIVHDDDAAYSVANLYTGLKQRRKGQYAQYNQVGHFHQKFTRYEEEHFPLGSKISRADSDKKTDTAKRAWSIEERFQARAMVLAGKRLYLAGWLDAMAIELKTGRPLFKGNADPHESVLHVYKAANGQRVAEYRLACDPVFDGIAAAYGDLFIALKNGRLLCMGPDPQVSTE